MEACVEVMADALRATSRGGAVLPLRSVVWMPDRSGMIGLMPGFLDQPTSLGLKVVSIFPGKRIASAPLSPRTRRIWRDFGFAFAIDRHPRTCPLALRDVA
jgi:hypothetical protein